ncbi:MAG: hypothetical protein EPN88_17540 [Bacteroidetes bacterium]|nr:MAG: hypothetical protein EPN88_17540 [Bacteroidota bacterium]
MTNKPYNPKLPECFKVGDIGPMGRSLTEFGRDSFGRQCTELKIGHDELSLGHDLVSVLCNDFKQGIEFSRYMNYHWEDGDNLK